MTSLLVHPQRGAGRCAGRALALLLALAACATARGPLDRPEGDAAARGASARALAQAGLDALLLRNDAATAARRIEAAEARDGADPWARLGGALLARRQLDDAGEATELVALVEGAPRHPLATVAARRLADLAGRAPALARKIEEGLARAQPRLEGGTAFRARAARAAALAALGERGRAAQLRAEAGAVTAVALAGPFGGLHGLELDTPFPPEAGPLPASAPQAAGLPPAPTRALAFPDGVVTLEGEPPGADLYYVAAEVTLARGGDYLLAVGGDLSLRAFLDGAPVAERRAYAGFPPLAQLVPLRLSAGTHRLLVKLGRGDAPGQLAVSFARADGAPSDATSAAAAPGTAAPAVKAGPLPPPLPGAPALALGLEREAGPVAAPLAAALGALDLDREAAKALLEGALRAAPRSAALLAFRAEARQDDPTLSERVARARAVADLDQALAADPGDAEARLARAELARQGDRLDDAAALLDALSEAAAARPRALLARARLAEARGLAAQAERFADEARRVGGDCAALELSQALAVRRDALQRQDELATALRACPAGLERLVEHRRRRGDLAGALALADEVVRLAPARIDGRLVRAGLRASRGDPRAAAADLEDLARSWPRAARLEKRRAEYLEAAGDAAGARAARERALLLDGSDLQLRRALALEGGHEPLDELDEDGAAALAAYRAAGGRRATSSVTVLDLGAVEAHPGGAYTERIHTLVEARDERAVDRVGEVAVPEGAELLEARTVKRDGRVLEPEEPLGDKRTLSLTGLEPGDLAEWIWMRTVPPRGAAVPGFSADPFYFRADEPLWRSVYTAAAPRGLGLEVDAHHLPPPPVREEGGREVVRVVREDVPALFPEPGAPALAEHLPFVQAGAGAGREALARAMADGLLEPCRPSLEVRQLAAELAASVPPAERGGEALPRAAYRRVQELILGQGGSFSEPAGAILSRGRGSRTVLLQSLLEALGVRSRLALVRDFGRDPAPYRFPRPDLYGYAVLRLERGGQVTWLDPTTRGTPYGVLPAQLRGAEALVLPGPGEQVEVARTPPDDGSERRRTRLAVTVDAEGGAVLEGSDAYTGFEAAALRASVERLDGQARRQAMEQMLARSFRGAALLDLAVDGEGALEGPVTLRWRAKVERWARLEEGRAVAEQPVFPARLGARFLQRAARETPLLVAGDDRASLELSVTLPAGWQPLPGAQAALETPFGSFRRVEQVSGGRLQRTDQLDLLRGRIAPADYPAFGAFARAVDAAQGEPLVFRRGTPG
ncbi:hypothetical protein [Anaeromyxobacter diazotrophicus]|uniref:DUF3857 domain-containing protein n=1 Tax=Anaeromyxobacter diazotrophicus TaxID=2590199 RepID=A0A7I9VSS4_9BACT|nr:hypothetical protein [Anaeromyxobacter diazotrophicus]GEJ59503.1 hypothetical protein AMYX_42440 [Anaeromyxobacter diazotrophicus]